MVTTRAMPSPETVLRACGWLAAGAALDRVEDLSSSHAVCRATRADGAAAVIKHRRDGQSRSIAGEFFIYRLAAWNEELGAVLARPILIDERTQMLVLEALSGVKTSRCSMHEPAVLRRIGTTLATVHRATMGRPIPTSAAAGILQVADHPRATGLDRPPQTQALMHRIADDALLADALRQAKASYRVRCLIHGDLRPEHWVEQPDGALRLIDWEMGGGGDPMLDLAAAFVEPALDAIRAGVPDVQWRAKADSAHAQLFAGYRTGGGDMFLDEAAAHCHLVRLAAARLLHIACEWSDAGSLGPSVEALLDCAVQLLTTASDASERLAA